MSADLPTTGGGGAKRDRSGLADTDISTAATTPAVSHSSDPPASTAPPVAPADPLQPAGKVIAAGAFPAEDLQAPVEEVVADPKRTSDHIQSELIQAEGRHARSGRLVGFIFFIIGIVIIVLGTTGDVTLDIVGGGVSVKLQTAVVGIAVCALAILVFWITRFKVDFRGRSTGK